MADAHSSRPADAAFGSRRAEAIPRSVFGVMDTAKTTAKEAGIDVLDLSIGSSDLSPPPEVLDALAEAVRNPRCHRYPLPSDSRSFQDAAARYLARRFGVLLNPSTEILPCAGAQEALAQVLLAATDPGDTILHVDPCYSPYLGAIACAGLSAHEIPVSCSTGLPNFCAVPTAVSAQTRVLLLNYPSNPRSQLATADFFAEAAAWCAEHGVLLVHDAPYVELTFGGYAAPIALTTREAYPSCRIVELFSLSKSHSMGGFRIGFAAGDAGAIAALARVQSVFGFGPPLAIQIAASAALDLPDEVIREGAAVFGERRDALISALTRAGGWELPLASGGGPMIAGAPGASMYVWAAHPRIAVEGGSVAFALALAAGVGVAVAPGRAFGMHGEGFVRFALVLPPAQLVECVARMQRWMEARQLD